MLFPSASELYGYQERELVARGFEERLGLLLADASETSTRHWPGTRTFSPWRLRPRHAELDPHATANLQPSLGADLAEVRPARFIALDGDVSNGAALLGDTRHEA